SKPTANMSVALLPQTSWSVRETTWSNRVHCATLPLGAAQLTVNAAGAVLPATTVTVCGLSPCTWQFGATPASSTECGPGPIWSRVTVAVLPMGPRSAPSRRRVYPSGSISSPPVLAETVILPLEGPLQTITKSVEAVAPAVTVTVRGFSPCTWQFGEMPDS